jgi:hypothetical protein
MALRLCKTSTKTAQETPSLDVGYIESNDLGESSAMGIRKRTDSRKGCDDNVGEMHIL